jgi:ribulose-phosphate 3-epimerase
VHAEACADLVATLDAVRATGARVGMSVNPDTPLDPYAAWFDRIDLLLVMTVHPGRGGQAFRAEVVPKVAEAAERRAAAGLGFAIEVDGGIARETAGVVRRAGADVLVAGSAIFGHPPYAERIAALRAAAVEATRRTT